MEFHPGSKKKAVGELLSQLLSRDPVLFNSAINSNFSSNVLYTGLGLKFEGASNLKHAAWLFNAVSLGGPATFDSKDIEWNEEAKSAKVRTIRYVRPRLFPLFGLAMPVETRLIFHADGNDDKKSASETKLYVTKLEDNWPTDRLLNVLPVIGWLYHTLVTPLATLLVLTLSNFLFAGHASVSSSKRHYFDSSVDALSHRAKKALPEEVSSSVGVGFRQGEQLAAGWGTSFINVINKTSYPILSTIEHVSQRGVSAVPLPLPYPYIYDAHSFPPGHAAKKDGEKKRTAAPATSKTVSEGKDSTSSIGSPPSQDHKTIPPAVVEVKPSLDGTDEGKTVNIPGRVNMETKEEPAPAKKPETDGSLYDQLRKDGELPKLPSAQEASSDDEEHLLSHGNNNAGQKKKKSGSKKKKGGASHLHAPSFKESLHQAEEHEAQPHGQ